ncbi:helix-turn-helix domain-containing protein [Thermincola ferriacetica]
MKKWDDFEQLVKSVHTEEEFNELKFVSDLISDLVKARIDKGWTQTELAQRTGLKQSAIARLESQSTIPKIDTLFKIAYALGLKLVIEDATKTETAVETQDAVSTAKIEEEVKELKEIVKMLVHKVDSLIDNKNNVKGKGGSKMKFAIIEQKVEQDNIIEQIWLDQTPQAQPFFNLDDELFFRNSRNSMDFDSKMFRVLIDWD